MWSLFTFSVFRSGHLYAVVYPQKSGLNQAPVASLNGFFWPTPVYHGIVFVVDRTTASYAQPANEISVAKISCPATALHLGPAGEVVGW
jgi:hypothetical protein